MRKHSSYETADFEVSRLRIKKCAMGSCSNPAEIGILIKNEFDEPIHIYFCEECAIKINEALVEVLA